ncbi:Sister chromatid cohesion protein pds5 [Yamadazyma tenuis]|uniref:Sister chromatid cohesion protein PDS5 n=1 Tax=Candida tenuis (strain ATCC 10573 / BCRC 21748 / CBS 615 / JCM 9827 / NBRC 10315 / NRRL Y-1498 / VKM Y-70) TaxID=590646 RepID=G3AW26_CANTC|nr:uncharacterized protein CANTEDRAFT_100752 [Yamadazyma tenuis ATCC 10573]EGV66434.1 hypothetical protein CANTEDRAFT_100752 [Yamadazyma tenuis ATCC 10573]WEJ95448.1 Sister chromatid cohesion protein pds5 [Yamadazyma tenuis]
MALSGETPPKSKLTFSKSIISTPQNPIATKDLVKRLQQLSEELSTIDQENPDLKSFDHIKQDLVNPKLLKSSNSGVQAYVCCALADILRVYAPDAPFTSVEISSIFKAFFNQFKKLSDTHNLYFQQQCYLLKRLAEVRSVVLIADVADSEQLIETAFNVFYDLSNKDFPHRLEPLICDILSEIMAEAEVLPHNVLKLVLDKLLTNNPNTSNITSSKKISNPGFKFSVSICEANADSMSRQIAQYFSEMLYETSQQMDHFKQDSTSKMINMKAIEALKRIHKLSIHIWCYVPGLLQSVMGLIEEELNADDETVRILATDAIGQMIGSSGSSQNFIINYRETWNLWLKKTLDVSSSVRCKWVEQVPMIINNASSLTSEVTTELCRGLNKCLLDSDEKVRLASCISIEKVPFESFTRIFNKDTMEILSQLIRERNSDIRKQAIVTLSNRCNQYFGSIVNNQVIDFGGKNKEESELEESSFKQIPNQLLSLIYIDDKDINSTLDVCLFEKLFPLSESTTQRVNRICQIFQNLNEKSMQAFEAINKRQQRSAEVMETFVKLCEDYAKIGTFADEKENVSESTKKQSNEERSILVNKLEKVAKWFSESISDGLNSFSCLERFFKLKNFRFLYLIRQAVSSNSDFLLVKNSIKELLTKLSNPKSIRVDEEKNAVSTTDMVSVFKLLLFRSSLIIYNKSNIVELLKFSKDSTHKWNPVSKDLLANVSETVPAVFTSHIIDLVDTIKDSETIPSTRAHNLKTLYHTVKKIPTAFPKDKEFGLLLEKLSIHGSPREAEFAIKLIGFSPKKVLLCAQVSEEILPLDIHSSLLPTHLAFLAGLLLVHAQVVEESISDISATLIKSILLSNGEITEDIVNDESFISDSILQENPSQYQSLVNKLLVLKIFTNRLKSLTEREVDEQQFVDTSKPIIKLFVMLVINGGEIVKEVPTPMAYRSRLRLEGGLSLLELARHSKFGESFGVDILNKLVLLVQDENRSVRSEFLKALQMYLSKDEINERFLNLVFFMNNEVDDDLSLTAQTWIKSMIKKSQSKKSIKFEKSLAILIHMLSHNPKFAQEQDTLKAYTFALEVLMFCLHNLLNSENISLLYYLASRVKQFRDATIEQSLYDIRPYPQKVNNVYCVAELCQLIIKEFSEHKNWPTLSWPGKLQLPKEFFTSLLSTSEAHAIITKVYISEELQIQLRGLIKQRLSSGNKKRPGKSNPLIKRIKTNNSKVRVVPKPKVPKALKSTKGGIEGNEPTRKSSRSRKEVNYGGLDSDSDLDMDMDESSDDNDF